MGPHCTGRDGDRLPVLRTQGCIVQMPDLQVTNTLDAKCGANARQRPSCLPAFRRAAPKRKGLSSGNTHDLALAALATSTPRADPQDAPLLSARQWASTFELRSFRIKMSSMASASRLLQLGILVLGRPQPLDIGHLQDAVPASSCECRRRSHHAPSITRRPALH